MSKPSGPHWTHEFKSSKSIDALKGSFKTDFKNFHDALVKAGAKPQIADTYRPPQRNFLMYWSWMIAKEDYDPEKVPKMSGIDIDWVHRDADKKADLEASKKAAEEMVKAYHTRYKPANPSKHSKHEIGEAADMSVSWSGDLTIPDGNGKNTTIKSSPRTHDNKDLQKLALSYGVKHNVHCGPKDDHTHWSTGG